MTPPNAANVAPECFGLASRQGNVRRDRPRIVGPAPAILLFSSAPGERCMLSVDKHKWQMVDWRTQNGGDAA